MNAKGGGQVPLEQWFARPREMGAQVGLTFNFDDITHAPNTLLSHQLIALAPADKREAVIDAVYAAYFEHGRNIGDIDVLVDIAASQGMEADDTREQLASDAKREAVLADAARGRQIGVQGVPFFVMNNRLAFSGAQPPQTILQVMQKAADMATEEQSS
jgi:predicted DsbA family dithiol-disulfide isomerase